MDNPLWNSVGKTIKSIDQYDECITIYFTDGTHIDISATVWDEDEYSLSVKSYGN